jgi:hypothetical protein
MIVMGIGGLCAFASRRKMSDEMRRATSLYFLLPRSIDLGMLLVGSILFLMMGFLTLFGIIR